MASNDSGEGVPPGRVELREYALLTGSAGQLGGDLPPSTRLDESIKEVDVPLELSSDATKEDKGSKIEVEEHAGVGAGTGEPKEPKVKMEEQDMDVLPVLSEDSMEKLGDLKRETEAGGIVRQRPRSSSKHEEDDAASESDGEDTGFNKSEVEEQHEDLGTCRTCGRSCASLRRLKAHKETGHDGATVLCRKCSQAYKTASNIKRHEALCGADTA